jgi:hypothetical protein
MGRGLIEPVDDLRNTNPATSDELLDELVKDFTAHHFDADYMIRTIHAGVPARSDSLRPPPASARRFGETDALD